MNRMLACVLGIAAVLVLAALPAQAQMPTTSNGQVVAIQPTTDAPTSPVSLAGLRTWLFEQLQSRARVGTSNSSAISRTPKPAMPRRVGTARTQTWVP